MKITVIGTGRVGLVSGACLAEVDNDVLCLDVDSPKIKILEDGVANYVAPYERLALLASPAAITRR